MSPDLSEKYVEAYTPELDEDQIRLIEKLNAAYFWTVAGRDILEEGSFEVREPDGYTDTKRALHPQIEPEQCSDELLSSIGRDGVVEMIANEELGLMKNFTTEYIPAVTEMIADTGMIEAMERGRPVVLLSDHDNWAAVALLGIGVSTALRNLEKPELAKKVALSVGLAASSFNNLSIGPVTIDQMQAINMFVDILKSAPDSVATQIVKNSIQTGDLKAEDDPLNALNQLTKEGFWDVLEDGGVIISGVSGSHDQERHKKIFQKEPAPGSAKTLFSDKVLMLDPLFIPCISLCDPFETGVRSAVDGHFEALAGFEFSSKDLTLRERLREFVTEVQQMKAATTLQTVEIEPHPRWGDNSFEYPSMSPPPLTVARQSLKTVFEKTIHNVSERLDVARDKTNDVVFERVEAAMDRRYQWVIRRELRRHAAAEKAKSDKS